jgi:hypothetical protein
MTTVDWRKDWNEFYYSLCDEENLVKYKKIVYELRGGYISAQIVHPLVLRCLEENIRPTDLVVIDGEISEEAIHSFLKLNSFEHVFLEEIDVSLETIEKIVESWPNLNYFSFRIYEDSNNEFVNETVRLFKDHQKIEKLTIFNRSIGRWSRFRFVSSKKRANEAKDNDKKKMKIDD